jgi:WD40 repeat protein
MRAARFILAATLLIVARFEFARADQSPTAKSAEPPKLDAYGDPLPPGAYARFGTLRLRHDAKAVAFFNDKTIVSAGSSIRFWDAVSGKLIREISPARMQDVSEAVISADGKQLITGHSEFGYRVWDLTTGRLIHEIKVKDAGVHDRQLVARLFASADGSRYVSRECFVKDAVSMPKKQTLHATIYATGSSAKPIQLMTEPDSVHLCGISPDGTCIITAGETEVNSSKGKPLVFWDAVTGKKLRTDDPKIGGLQEVRFSPDGQSFVLVGEFYVVLRTIDGRELWRRPTEREGPSITGLTSDRLILMAIDQGTGTIRTRIVDIANGLMVGGWRISGREVSASAISPDAKRVVIASEMCLHVCNLANGATSISDSGHETPVTTANVIANGRSLFSHGELDSDAILWDVGTGSIVRRFHENEGLCSWANCSCDGRLLATSSSDGTVRIREIATGRQLSKLTGFDDGVDYTWFMADGNKLAVVGGGAKRISIYDYLRGEKIDELNLQFATRCMLYNRPDGRLMAKIHFAEPNNRGTFDPASGFDIWDVQAKRVFRHFDSGRDDDGFGDVSADWRTLVSCGADGVIHVWEVATGKLRCSFLASNAEDGGLKVPNELALSPDGATLVCAVGGRIDLRDLATGKRFASFKAHNLDVRALNFTPDGQRLITASRDTTLLGWDMTRPEWRSRRHEQPLTDAELARHWESLRGKNAEEAYRSKWALVGDPTKTVEFLCAQLPSTTPISAEQIKSWISDLDSSQYSVRERAQRELQNQFDQTEESLRKTLAGSVSAEARNRINRIIDVNFAAIPQPDQLRDMRAIEVLEQIGTPEARDLLRRLAPSAVATRTSRDAAQSLKRLEARPR